MLRGVTTCEKKGSKAFGNGYGHIGLEREHFPRSLAKMRIGSPVLVARFVHRHILIDVIDLKFLDHIYLDHNQCENEPRAIRAVKFRRAPGTTAESRRGQRAMLFDKLTDHFERNEWPEQICIAQPNSERSNAEDDNPLPPPTGIIKGGW